MQRSDSYFCFFFARSHEEGDNFQGTLKQSPSPTTSEQQLKTAENMATSVVTLWASIPPQEYWNVIIGTDIILAVFQEFSE